MTEIFSEKTIKFKNTLPKENYSLFKIMLKKQKSKQDALFRRVLVQVRRSRDSLRTFARSLNCFGAYTLIAPQIQSMGIFWIHLSGLQWHSDSRLTPLW